jgi:hypothetical protein
MLVRFQSSLLECATLLLMTSTTTARSERPLGATDPCPLVVSTKDLARFVNHRLTNGGAADRIVQQIKTCKERGVTLTVVSNDTLKKIYTEQGIATADNAAEAILLSQGASDQLGKEIPLYRNPFMETKTYISTMKKRLHQGWDDEIDGKWDDKFQMEYILSFPSITPP